MSHTPHELAEDFSEFSDKISELEQSNPHFSTLTDSYHKINRSIHRAESNIEPTSEDHLSEMRKSRMALKDQIYRYLSPA